MGVAVVICARAGGLTLGPIVSAYNRYASSLPCDHPVLEMLMERFGEVAVDAEEDIMKRLEAADLPAQGREIIASARELWGAPNRWLGGRNDPLFPGLETAMKRLISNCEDVLTAKLPHCRTRAGFDAMEADIERELGSVHTTLRGRVRSAKANFKERTDLFIHTGYGWPPVAQLAQLASAGRWFAIEFGQDYPAVCDFNAAVKRIRLVQEREFADALRTKLEVLTKLRAKVWTDPPPPRLLAQGYEEELAEYFAEAVVLLEQSREELGTESSEVLTLAKGILLPGPFAAQMLMEAGQAADVLRRPLPPANPGFSEEEGQERLAASVRLLQILVHLERSLQRDALRQEFAQDLERAHDFVGLFNVEDVIPEEGWHRPPGLELVDQPPNPPPTLPPTPPRTATPEPEPLKPDVMVDLRLHGVTLEEAQQNSELILLDKLAAIVAKQCGIPHSWVSLVELSAPRSLRDVTPPSTASAASADLSPCSPN